jgi:hypothetical protein
MDRRQQVIAAHRAEGEPQTMARVQGMCDERWPGRSALQWIEHVGASPRRHVAVTFARERIEGTASTWLDAMDLVDAERRRRRIGS